MTDFSDMARGIIESNRYMVLGTADEDGVPWVTPVWFAQSDHRRFIWDVQPPAPHRLYRATVSQHWVLDPDSSPDDRAAVTL